MWVKCSVLMYLFMFWIFSSLFFSYKGIGKQVWTLPCPLQIHRWMIWCGEMATAKIGIWVVGFILPHHSGLLVFLSKILITSFLLSYIGNTLLQLPEGTEGGTAVNGVTICLLPLGCGGYFIREDLSHCQFKGWKWKSLFWTWISHVVPTKPTHKQFLTA